ncbi:MAG: RNA polymerase sigma-70 factor (ECF subfamily) [Verrucomicrobiales bacterium]|jgi:RNA polymerase sigma-70 factor (ECF subfamily)
MKQNMHNPAAVRDFIEPVKSPDADLMIRIANRDARSFETLQSSLAGPVFSTAYRVLNNTTEAEEVAQDVFVQIWAKATTYEPRKGKPITWATTMARNRAIDRFRANRRRFRLRDDFKTELDATAPIRRRPDASENARKSDDARVVREAVAELTPDQREAIELVYFAGLTQREAATRLKQPLGTVKARIRRGIHRLRETTPAKM